MEPRRPIPSDDGRRGIAAPASTPAERAVSARTRKQLLERTIELIAAQGRVPSVSEVALASGVSRATAYRYFPSRSRLIASVVDYSLGPMRAWNPKSSDGRARVAELFESTFARFIEYEPQMRAALQLALEHAALEAAGVLDEEPYRRGYRIGILRNALAPLQPKLTRRSHELLSKALSLVYGIESYVVLKDIWKADNREVEAVARWMVDALVSHAVATGARSTAVRDGRPAGRSAS